MDVKVRIIKPLRYGTTIWESGTIGIVVEETNPFTYKGEPIYDCYIKLGYKTIGVFKHEIEVLES